MNRLIRLFACSGFYNKSLIALVLLMGAVQAHAALTLTRITPTPVKFGQVMAMHISGGASNEAYTYNDGSFLGGGGRLDANGEGDLTPSTENYEPGSVSFSVTGSSTTSNSIPYTIEAADSTVSVTSDIQPSTPGQNVALTATVASVPNGAILGKTSNFNASFQPNPGTVQFKDNGTNIGGAQTITNNNGVYTATLSFAFTGGTHTVTAVYTGESTYSFNAFGMVQTVNGSTSADYIQNVGVGVSVGSSFSDPSSATSIPVTVTFSDNVTGFDTSDLTLSNASISNFAGSGSIYTFDLSPNTLGAASVTVNASAAQDGQGNTNSAVTLNRTFVAPLSPGQEPLISEFRFRGPQGTNDEFIELYNNTDDPMTVATSDGSAGWALVAANSPTVPCAVVPAGATIPARGHYLIANNGPANDGVGGFSLGALALLDITYTTDIPDGSGVALFSTSDPAGLVEANRLDAAGYAAVDSLFRIGAGFPDNRGSGGSLEFGNNLEYSFVRKVLNSGPTVGRPQNTPDNLTDFRGVVTNGAALSTTAYSLGAPGPENTTSPLLMNDTIQVSLLDPSVPSSDAPNRVVDYNDRPLDPSDAGSVIIRRIIKNLGNTDITRLRLRVTDQTTLPVPTGTADTRVTSADFDTVIVNGNPVNVLGTSLVGPESPVLGGGLNSSLEVDDILGDPLVPGASVCIQVKLAIHTWGSTFRFVANFEGSTS